MKPIRSFMKHCTAKQLECARAIIPGILETHPYNARFLDVTSAEGFIECYSPDHPTTRAGDRANRQALQRYVSDELGLVCGGEHGRWWSVPYLDYHEGMMGGGHYSWPAGYLRDVESRDELSENYLNYGINPANRVPLFELAYHDCVVNYWYWGATNDYLHEVAPEITERKTAMNILYGTPPMMWVNSHGLRWSVPEEREQMLTIYRNVCKLHEVIGMQEMVSHEFLTEDRTVQLTRWEDGTVCTVNFGKEPFEIAELELGLVLEENDFFVRGPNIVQWRGETGDPEQPGGAERVTYIEADARYYIFVDSGDTEFDDQRARYRGRVSVRTEDEEHVTITLAPGSRLESGPPFIDSWPNVLLRLDEMGSPVARLPWDGSEALALQAPPTRKASYLVLAGSAALVPDVTIADLTLSAEGRQVAPQAQLAPQDEIKIALMLRNEGLAGAEAMTLTVHLDSPDGPRLAAFGKLALGSGEESQAEVTLPASLADGPRNVVALLSAPEPVSLVGRTKAQAAFTGPVSLELFPVRRHYVLTVPPGNSAGMAVELPFDLADHAVHVDPANLRVLFEGGDVVPVQFEATQPGGTEGTLVFCLPPGLPAGEEVTVQVLGAAPDSDVFPHTSRFDVAADGSRIRMGTYQAKISRGVLNSIAVLTDEGELPVAENIIVSSAETGWSTEEGEVEEFKMLANGPVRAVFACTKVLRNGTRLTRRWDFY
ncbi:MAG: hypothetical protein KAX19_00760, partial [Candidatus Brocadiae bacterium]|nr:hypothetical protein [Candidatus Brocadiia bacterium]